MDDWSPDWPPLPRATGVTTGAGTGLLPMLMVSNPAVPTVVSETEGVEPEVEMEAISLMPCFARFSIIAEVSVADIPKSFYTKASIIKLMKRNNRKALNTHENTIHVLILLYLNLLHRLSAVGMGH